MKHLIFIALVVFSLMGFPPAHAEFKTNEQKLKEGFAAYKAKDFRKAAFTLMPLAVADMPEAQYHIGRMHDYGEYFKENFCLATLWYDKAARRGHIHAQALLANNIWSGHGVKKNFHLAYTWMLAAANAGDDYAREQIPYMLKGRSLMAIEQVEKSMKDFKPENMPPVELYFIPYPLDTNVDISWELRNDYGLGNCSHKKY